MHIRQTLTMFEQTDHAVFQAALSKLPDDFSRVRSDYCQRVGCVYNERRPGLPGRATEGSLCRWCDPALLATLCWTARFGQISHSLSMFYFKDKSVYEVALQQLPEEFNRGLCSIFLNCGHVDVVNEDEALRIALSSIDLLSLLDKLRLDVSLGAAAVSLGGEVEHDRKQRCLLPVLRDEVLDDHRLSRAGASRHEDWLAEYRRDMFIEHWGSPQDPNSEYSQNCERCTNLDNASFF